MAAAYRLFGYFGLFSIFAAVLFGFRYDPLAPWGNYAVDLLLYVAWAGVHLLMTTAGFKQRVYGADVTSGTQRRVFVTVSVVTWLALLVWQRPLPGPSVHLPEWLQFGAMVGFLVTVMAFFEGVSFAAIDGMLGVPASEVAYSHCGETPLFTEGRYAAVRHPQYQAVILAGLCGLLIHPNAAQVLWTMLIGATFVVFIPVEEGRLVGARGEAYRAYMEQTPWRLFRGLW